MKLFHRRSQSLSKHLSSSFSTLSRKNSSESSNNVSSIPIAATSSTSSIKKEEKTLSRKSSNASSTPDDELQSFNFTEVLYASDGCIHVTTTAMFFKEVDASIEKDRETRTKKTSLKRSNSRLSLGSLNSLESINEDKEMEGDNYVKDHKVRIISVVVPHDGDSCAQFVAKHLHQEIVEHPGFTSIAGMPSVFRDAFVHTDDAFIKSIENSNDESGCSVITAVITSTNSICIAHVGDVRGIIRGTDGTVAEISSGHVISKSPKEKARLSKVGANVGNDQKLFGKLIYSRAFGHKSLKSIQPDVLICLPNVIQIQMNFNSSSSSTSNDNGKESSVDNTTTISGDWESHSVRSASRMSKVKREDVLLLFGSSSSWQFTTDKKLCGSIIQSLSQDEPVVEMIEGAIHNKQSMSLFRKSSDLSAKLTPRGLGVINWTKYS